MHESGGEYLNVRSSGSANRPESVRTSPASLTGSSDRAHGHRLRSLDGIRAFAVCAVLLFHAGVPGVSGGLLGVDVFFVLSGFLITSLLCSERSKTGTIRLRGFWAARARRLLPGLFLLLIGVAVYAWVLRYSVDVSTIRGDAIATLLYVANWHFILSDQGYFTQSMTPSPLLHMWSLGVEEQYYLIWPFVCLLVLRKGPRVLAWVAGVGCLASALLMAVMYGAGFSTDRLYYGTDTRAQALLVGSCLGALASRREWRVINAEWASRRWGRITGATVGAGSAVLLVWFWHSLNGQDSFLYQGGFLLVSLCAGGVITNVTSWRASVLSRICSFPPITYIGRISYGLYLYHWPLFLAIDHAHTGLYGAELLAVRLAATFVAAVVSFHLVEQPVRTGRLGRSWRGLSLAGASAVAACAAVVVATVPPAFATVPLTREQPKLTRSLHQELAAAHAFTTNPIRFVLVGDSVAYTAGGGRFGLSKSGLGADSVQRYGVELFDEGILGCDLSINPSMVGGVEYRGVPGVNCGSWPAVWAGVVRKYDPEVVGMLIGRFELADHYFDGKWMYVGEPAWDAQLIGSLDEAIDILSARGAHVVIFTFPYIDPPVEQPNGDPWPENLPSRVVAWNALLRQVAKAHPKTTTLINLNQILDPAGHYTSVVDGVLVRPMDDGIHITLQGGEWLQSSILPEVARLGIREELDAPTR